MEGFAERGGFKPWMNGWGGDRWWEWWVDGADASHSLLLVVQVAETFLRRGRRRLLSIGQTLNCRIAIADCEAHRRNVPNSLHNTALAITFTHPVDAFLASIV